MASRASAVWAFEAIGTAWSIETAHDLPAEARAEVGRVVEGFDRDWSRFRDDSMVARLGRSGGTASSPPDAVAMLDLYAELDAATDGAVNPLVGDVLARLGYGPPGAGDADGVPAWRDALGWDERMLRLAAPATIDVGALGKGRLVDLVHDIVRAHAPGPVVVDASGDIAVSGTTQRIALEHPFHTDRAIGVWEVTDAALCASAVNRRAWGDGLHHVLDARTGRPVRAYTATWAVASTAMRADALATALFFDGGPELAHRWSASWVRMRTDGRVEWSPGCEAELFS